jgi:hypothetical protein
VAHNAAFLGLFPVKAHFPVNRFGHAPELF